MAKRANGEGTINKRQDGRWEARVSVGFKPDGTPNRKTLYGRTQGEVKEKAEKLKRQLADGSFIDSKQTVKDFLEDWLKQRKRSLKPTTFINYATCVNNFIVPQLGHVILTKLTPMQVQTFISNVLNTSGASRAAKCRSVLLNAYGQALRWQLVVRNPVEATDPVKEKPRDMTLWEAEEATRFLDAAREHRLYPLFYLAMATGLRRGELLGLRWIDLEGSLLHVRQTLVKAGNELLLSTPKTAQGFRTIALSRDVLEVLLLHRQRQEAEQSALSLGWTHPELVFTSEIGTPLNPDNLTRTLLNLHKAAVNRWEKEAQELGDAVTLKRLKEGKLMPKVTLHGLRHLHASVAIKGGMDAKTVADRLGHARASFTLDRYTHLFESQRAKSAVSITGWLTSGRAEPN